MKTWIAIDSSDLHGKTANLYKPLFGFVSKDFYYTFIIITLLEVGVVITGHGLQNLAFTFDYVWDLIEFKVYIAGEGRNL